MINALSSIMTTVFILFTSLRHSDYHSIIILMSESYPYDSNYALNVQKSFIIHCSVLSPAENGMRTTWVFIKFITFLVYYNYCLDYLYHVQTVHFNECYGVKLLQLPDKYNENFDVSRLDPGCGN